ncbi:hypothetical protein JCM8547_008629 [Rhodosporidiobolus lusitaniae]
MEHDSGQRHPLAGVGHAHPPPAPVHFSHPLASTSACQPHAPSYSNSPESPASAAPLRAQQPAKKARKSAGGGTAAAGSDGEEDGPARKKSKQSLSCGECKRRKIKWRASDRKIPCSSCIKRGAAESCNWEDAKIEPEKQPFALVNDVDELRERISLIERYLNTLPAPLRSTMRELGIKTFGTRPYNDIKTEQIAHDEFTDMEKHIAAVKAAAGQNDSLGVLDSVLFGGDNLMKGNTRLEPHKPELTAAYTCINSPKILYVDPATSTNLGLDLCFNQEELDAERYRTVERIYKLLPSKQDSYTLIRRYFSQFEWFFALLHHGSFFAEVDKFWELHDAGRKHEVDPAWLATFYLVMALAADDSVHMSFDSPLAASENWLERGAALQAAAQKLLHLSDPFGRPQVRVIQCTVLLACWTLVSAHGGEYGRFSSWLACAIRSAQKLGLHRLTDDPEDMPPDDPAWPPGKNSVKREGALRLWAFLTFFDWIAASARFKAYMINPNHTTTPMMSNVNSSELSPTGWHITPSPPSVLTDASLEMHKLKMATISRKTFDSLVASGTAFNYGTIVNLDREYRELLASMPDVFQQEYMALEKEDPIIKGKRYIALQGVHNRIVRLHRPFLVKGWQHPKFSFSTDACIKSAKVVLVSHHNNLDVNRNLRMMYSHSLSASIVLAADLFHAIDTGASATETESKKEVLAMALEVFSEKVQEGVASRHLRLIIESARRVLTGLFLEQEKRRARRVAYAASGETPADEKPFAEILQALAHQVDAASSADQPPPSTSQPSNGALILSPAAPQPPTPAIGNASLNDPLGMMAMAGVAFDPTLPNPYNADALGPLPGLRNGLWQDMGLIPFGDGVNGSGFNTYWAQGQPGVPPMQNSSGVGLGSLDGSTGSNETSPLDLAAFLGVGSTGTSEQATQALLSQMAGGW